MIKRHILHHKKKKKNKSYKIPKKKKDMSYNLCWMVCF